MKYTAIMATTYGGGNYSSCDYSTATQASGHCVAASGATQGGGLANTGIGIVAVVTFACIVIFVSLLVRFWRRKQVVFQNVEVLENHRQPERH